MSADCPNCIGERRSDFADLKDACVLEALAGVVRDDGEDVDLSRLAEIDTEAFWDMVEPARAWLKDQLTNAKEA